MQFALWVSEHLTGDFQREGIATFLEWLKGHAKLFDDSGKDLIEEGKVHELRYGAQRLYFEED
ncbi:MAG: hypothetical protein JSW12_17940 [Deltaproteobacteria bacterium]|nr:MAG: hypothetical protein JSW12_17940 [Deltaproteobacteria bacterium]